MLPGAVPGLACIAGQPLIYPVWKDHVCRFFHSREMARQTPLLALLQGLFTVALTLLGLL